MKRIFALFGAFILVSASFAWAEIGIEASVNPSRAIVGEPMTLTVMVSGAGAGVKSPKLPDFANFRSYSQGSSQEISFVNGKMSSRSVFSFVLIPSVPGKHVLGQIEVYIDGKVYKTGVLEVEVVDAPASGPGASSAGSPVTSRTPVTPSSPRSLPPEYMAGRDVFVRAWVDKEDVYVNEPIYLTYTVYTRVSATFKGFDKEPVTTGFWVEEFPPQGAASRQEKQLGGYRYVIADVRTVALFPTEVGTFTLDPGVLKIDAEIAQQTNAFDNFQSNDIFGWRSYRRPASFFTQLVPKLLATEPIPITVRATPEANKPADYRGAVGRFKLEATLDRSAVDEGEPVVYTLKLSGEGNLNTVELPKLPEIDYLKMYDSSSSTNVRKDRLIVEGDKTLETVLIPKKGGAFKIPSLSFSYYDPSKRMYQTLTTPELPLQVTPAKEDAQQAPIAVGPGLFPQQAPLVGEDIRFIKMNPETFRKGVPLVVHPVYGWAHAGVLALAFLLFLLRVVSERALQNVSGLRMKRSHGVARARLKTAHSHLKKGSETAFYDALSSALYGYFSDKFDLGPGEFSTVFVDTQLRGRLSEDEAKRLKEIIHAIQFGRFARADSGLDEMKNLYASCDDWISAFETKRFVAVTKRAAIAIFLFCVVSAGAVSAHAADDGFAKGTQFYENGKFPEAGKEFAALIKSGAGSAAAYYNLGNSFFKMNNKAGAAWAYEKALQIDPRDEDTRVNLDILRKQMTDRQEETMSASPISIVGARIFRLRSDEIAYAFSGCVALAALSLLLHAFVPVARGFASKMIVLFFLLSGITGGAAYVRRAELLTRYGIVSDKEIFVRYGPSEDSTKAFLLHEGTKVLLIKESGNWRFVQYGRGQKGWLPEEAILRL